VPNNTRGLKVTVAYPDREGGKLENDLSLSMKGAYGLDKRGDEGFEAENNVEPVVWANRPPGKAVVTVLAQRITRLDDLQGFALVCRIVEEDTHGVGQKGSWAGFCPCVQAYQPVSPVYYRHERERSVGKS
jgi:hypothetical protein